MWRLQQRGFLTLLLLAGLLELALDSGCGAAAKQLSWSLPVVEEDEPAPAVSPDERVESTPPAADPPSAPADQQSPRLVGERAARPRSSRKKKRQQRWLHLAEKGMQLFQEGDMRGCVAQLQVRVPRRLHAVLA
jgi:hypothetical protein